MNYITILKNNLLNNLDFFSTSIISLPILYYIKRLIFNGNKTNTLINLTLHILITLTLFTILAPMVGTNKILLTKLLYIGTTICLFMIRKTVNAVKLLWRMLPIIIIIWIIAYFKLYQNINVNNLIK